MHRPRRVAAGRSGTLRSSKRSAEQTLRRVHRNLYSSRRLCLRVAGEAGGCALGRAGMIRPIHWVDGVLQSSLTLVRWRLVVLLLVVGRRRGRKVFGIIVAVLERALPRGLLVVRLALTVGHIFGFRDGTGAGAVEGSVAGETCVVYGDSAKLAGTDLWGWLRRPWGCVAMMVKYEIPVLRRRCLTSQEGYRTGV